jgi:hypothetical protein
MSANGTYDRRGGGGLAAYERRYLTGDSTPRAISGNRPDTSARRLDVHEPGRICGYPPCTTVLSIYNQADRCHTHDNPTHRVLERLGAALIAGMMAL